MYVVMAVQIQGMPVLLASDLPLELLVKYLDRFTMYYIITADRCNVSPTSALPSVLVDDEITRVWISFGAADAIFPNTGGTLLYGETPLALTNATMGLKKSRGTQRKTNVPTSSSVFCLVARSC